MTGAELRERIKHLGLTYRAAAPRLGLSLAGLHHNMRDERPIGRQTEIILDYLEREAGRSLAGTQKPRGTTGARPARVDKI